MLTASYSFFMFADVLLSEIVPRILRYAQRFIVSNSNLPDVDAFESQSGSQFWFNIMEAIKDQYAVEKLSEQLLHQLVTENASDVEAYWTVWILFHQIFKHQTSVK